MKRVRKYEFLIYVVPLCLVWACGVSAQAKNTLSCAVVDEKGSPVAKQEFMLTSAGGKQSKKKTNDQGEVKFTGLDDGTYTMGGEGSVPGKYEVSGNSETACKYTVVSGPSANAKLQEVLQLVQEKKFGEAEEKAKKLVELMPGEASTHYVLARAYAAEGKDDAALPEVKKASDLNPEKWGTAVATVHLMALDAQAKQLESKRDFEGAVKKYEEMAAASPKEPIAYYGMALAYGNAGKFDQALKSIDKAIEMKPDDADFQKAKIVLQDKFLEQMNKKLEKK